MPPEAVRRSRPPARSAPSPQVRRRRVVLVAVVAVLLVLLALPVRALGGSTLAQAAPALGRTTSSNQVTRWLHRLAGRSAAAPDLAAQLAREVGSSVVVPGEHIHIP